MYNFTEKISNSHFGMAYIVLILCSTPKLNSLMDSCGGCCNQIAPTTFSEKIFRKNVKTNLYFFTLSSISYKPKAVDLIWNQIRNLQRIRKPLICFAWINSRSFQSNQPINWASNHDKKRTRPCDYWSFNGIFYGSKSHKYWFCFELPKRNLVIISL